MTGQVVRTTLAALLLLALRVVDAAAAGPVRLAEPAALDLPGVALVVPDDGRVAGPDDLAAIVERGEPVAVVPLRNDERSSAGSACRGESVCGPARSVQKVNETVLTGVPSQASEATRS